MTPVILLICLPIVVAFPMFIPIYILVGIIWIFSVLPKDFSFAGDQPSATKTTKDAKIDLSKVEDFVTSEERIRREMERVPFKKDFKKNPKWQELTRKLKEQVDKAEREEKEIMKKLEQDEEDAKQSVRSASEIG